MAREAVETSTRTMCVRDRKGEWHMKSSLRPGWNKKSGIFCVSQKKRRGVEEEATSKADANENGSDQR